MSRRKRRKDRGPCALVSALTGPSDEVAEQMARELALRPRRPRFDGQGRRLARIHSLFRAEGRKMLPMIRLSGRWLEATGFPIGTRFSVEVDEEELLIRAL